MPGRVEYLKLKEEDDSIEDMTDRKARMRAHQYLRANAQRGAAAIRAILKTELFAGISLSAAREVASAMHFRDFAKGQSLCKQGDAASQLLVILQGAGRVLVDGKEVAKVGILDSLGEAALVVDSHVRSATVVAMMGTHTLVLSRKDYRRLLLKGVLKDSVDAEVRARAEEYSKKAEEVRKKSR